MIRKTTVRLFLPSLQGSADPGTESFPARTAVDLMLKGSRASRPFCALMVRERSVHLELSRAQERALPHLTPLAQHDRLKGSSTQYTIFRKDCRFLANCGTGSELFNDWEVIPAAGIMCNPHSRIFYANSWDRGKPCTVTGSRREKSSGGFPIIYGPSPYGVRLRFPSGFFIC